MSRLTRCLPPLWGVLVVLIVLSARTSVAEEASKSSALAEASTAPPTLRFSFERTPWRDVIKWVAEECELALQFDELPVGSFSYSDPNPFTHDKALSRLNLFLLPQGYSLVRSGRLLSVINLSDPRGLQQLDVLARRITPDQLDELADHEVAKCLFRLQELAPDEAIEELAPLKLMASPATFSKTNQILVTDTVAKLKTAKTILDAFEPSSLGNGTVVKSFSLEHIPAEDVLLVARPHLGLATDEMIGIDVSLSADLQGKNIFVTGVEDKVAVIERLVSELDRPKERLSTSDGSSVLQSHLVEGGNVQMVYDVLQTLLADQSLRLSMDESASSVVALASPEIQTQIAATVSQLQASDADFEVIPLKSVDPFFAISLLEEMLDLPDPLDDPDEIDPDAPKIDADPGNRRLFVRAKRHQIEQIKKIVAGFDSVGVESSSDFRVIPIKGAAAIEALETGARFWRRSNPILLFPSSQAVDAKSSERVVGEDDPKPDPAYLASTANPIAASAARMLGGRPDSDSPMIRCQITPQGLVLQCDDASALDAFEEHLQTVAGPMERTASPPVVFYLKYTKATDALRMLAELLDGGEAAKEGESGTLVNGYISGGSSYLGSIVTSRDGTTTMIAGSITVVADSRLNRLIAQGTSTDIQQIESYLNIVDKDTSLTSVQTYGTSRVIELLHTQADEVAAAIREAYAGRIAGGQASGAAAGAKGQADPRQAQQSDDSKGDDAKKKSAAKRTPTQAPKNLEPQMTLAVHQPSNSLIVTAPDQLFEEVRRLVEVIDTRSEQAVEVFVPANDVIVQALMESGALTGVPMSTSRSRSSSPTRSTRSTSSSSRTKSSR
ncbi:MAG: secretin N-terminal domain-containing protein [Planctomycetota bacterium]